MEKNHVSGNSKIKKKDHEEFNYKQDDAYLYADKGNHEEFGLVIVLVTICIVAFILTH